MYFNEAFNLMKTGTPVKLPSWGGYWCWDNEKKTIMMHCKEKDSDTGKAVLDIRETQRVEYTLENLLSPDWIVATSENCPVLGGEATFSFSDAIRYLKRGMRLARKGWNGKDQYIEIAHNITYVAPNRLTREVCHDAIGRDAIAFHGTSGVQMGWLASQADMLAEDWTFAEKEEE